jgi:hypothetical protein
LSDFNPESGQPKSGLPDFGSLSTAKSDKSDFARRARTELYITRMQQHGLAP